MGPGIPLEPSLPEGPTGPGGPCRPGREERENSHQQTEGREKLGLVTWHPEVAALSQSPRFSVIGPKLVSRSLPSKAPLCNSCSWELLACSSYL